MLAQVTGARLTTYTTSDIHLWGGQVSDGLVVDDERKDAPTYHDADHPTQPDGPGSTLRHDVSIPTIAK